MHRIQLAHFSASVLVADESQHIEEFIRNGLLNLPVNFRFVENDEDQILKEIEHERPELLLSSTQLIRGNPIRMLQGLVGIPSIFLGHHRDAQLEHEILKGGASHLVVQPFEVTDLHQRIESVVRTDHRFGGPKSRLESFVEQGQPATRKKP